MQAKGRGFDPRILHVMVVGSVIAWMLRWGIIAIVVVLVAWFLLDLLRRRR